MKEIKAFQCDYCDKYYKHKSSAKRHENRCFKNHKNKACLTCGNFKTDYETVYVRPQGDQNYGDADYERKYNYCAHSDETFDGVNQAFQVYCNYWIPIEFNEDEYDDIREDWL